MFGSLTATFRAVEVFIRDKYERKKYCDREAVAAAAVSITVSTPACGFKYTNY